MKLTRHWIIVISTLVFLVLVLVALRIFYAQELATDPEELVEEYARFLGGIASMIFGFYLVNVLWNQHIKAYQIRRFKKILAHFYLKIHTFCQQIKQLLAQDFNTDDQEESQQRDHRVQEILQRLRALSHWLESYAPEAELIDDDVMRDTAINTWTDIQTNLERLPVGQDFRVDLDEFEEIIETLIASTGRAAKLLLS